MIAEAAAFLVPTATVPVTSEVWRIRRDDDKMTNANLDRALAAGTHVGFARLVWLYWVHRMVIECTMDFRRINRATGRHRHRDKSRQEAGEHPVS